VLGRVLPALGVLTLTATGCAAPNIVVRPEEAAGPSWFTLVVDAEGNAGGGVSLATDVDGNPHLAYLAVPEELPAGEEAPAPDPLAPTLPAVMHAHLVQEVWTRGPVADEQAVLEASTTTIAVDADGIHHVAWTAGGQVLYSSNAEGEFAEPEVVGGDFFRNEVPPISIAVDARGTPWVIFQQVVTFADHVEPQVWVATRGPKEWEAESVATLTSFPEPSGVAIGFSGNDPLVAYGDGSSTSVATLQGTRWVSETVDPDGGLGVAMDVDTDGIPHLAYYDASGAVKHAHPAGDGWDISDVGGGATGSTTSIAVDVAGVHHVAWQTAEGVAYASNAEGDFAEEELPEGTAGGSQPKVGAGAEGTVYLAFYDAEGTELQMVVRAEDEPLLAVPSPEEAGAPGAQPGGPPPCQPEGTELAITAQNLAFDTDCLAAPAGEAFTIEFNNQDAGVPHNVAIYTDDSAAEVLFQEPPSPGPGTVVYEPEPIEEEGNFFFRCDVHPTTMTGTFVVAGAGGGGGGGG
jgi:hypothetical protein